MAFSPAASSVQGSTGATLSHAGYFSYAVLIHPEQGRFTGPSDIFTPVKTVSVSPYSRFAPYTKTGVGSVRTFTESDNGRTITLTRGQVVKVQLNENPTTGYRWEPSVSSGIQITGDSYVASASGRMGAGGTRTWTLKITGTGNQQFDAGYKRSWEPGSADSYSIQFVVA
ncbi:MAG: protease inhibitor I42 family protein [Methanoregulaceae archaeon]|nr:protease inhibitor I42 family protein [Methanoregulaceae archaeon]